MKNLSIVLILLLGVSLFSCNDNQESNEDNKTTENNTVAENQNEGEENEVEVDTIENEDPVEETKDLPTETYRSDQYEMSPGIISEYIKLTLSSDRQNIKKIEYWYLTRDGDSALKSEVYDLKIRKSEKFEGEEVGNRGELMFPETGIYQPFSRVEGVFEIIHGAEMVQVFEMEQ